MQPVITKHDCGVVQLPNGKVIHLSKSKPMYRATKMIDGKEYAFLDPDRDKVKAWLEAK